MTPKAVRGVGRDPSCGQEEDEMVSGAVAWMSAQAATPKICKVRGALRFPPPLGKQSVHVHGACHRILHALL